MEINLEYKVLDKGFIRVVDTMGSDDSVLQAARISYGKGTKSVRDDRHLIRYLMKHRHSTPFEMCEIKVHVRAPIFVARQWVRHRTASINEYSARYSEVVDDFYYPTKLALQKQSKSNKQGRDGSFSNEEYTEIIADMQQLCENAYAVYRKMLDHDVARETARCVLPLNTYTEFYWKIDAHNLMHFLKLRCDAHAQHEIREYAVVLRDIFAQWMPVTYEAFMDYVVNAKTYSSIEYELISQSLDMEGLAHSIDQEERMSNREKGAMKASLE